MKFREIIVKSINTEAGNYTNIDDETKSFKPLDIYLVPKQDGSHDRYVTDEEGIVSKQSSEGSSVGTLNEVLVKGNSTDKHLVLNGSILEYNQNLVSHRFGGNPSSNTIGAKSVIYGANALNANTTGSNNTAIGYNTLNANTTGHRNTAVGIYALEIATTGWNNTSIGNSSGQYLTTGYDNIIIGRAAGTGISTGNNNITIGNMVGVNKDSIQSNNVIIGHIPGSVPISNKLIIHNQNIVATTTNPNGSYTPAGWSASFIYGDFVDKWLIFNSSLQVKRLPQADATFTKNIVSKPDGTFGLEEKSNSNTKLSYSNQEKLTDSEWLDGKKIYRKTIKLVDIPSNGEIDLIPHFNNIETIVSNQMFTEWYAMDVAFAGNQYRGKAFITLLPEMVQIEYISGSDYDYSLINSFTLTLEYTKKTD